MSDEALMPIFLAFVGACLVGSLQCISTPPAYGLPPAHGCGPASHACSLGDGGAAYADAGAAGLPG